MAADRRVICFSTNWPDYRLEAGIVAYARHHGWQILNLNHTGTQVFPLHTVDGLIANITGRWGQNLRERAERWACPAVSLSDHRAGWAIPAQGCVVHDDHAIGRLAAEHFVHLGFRDVCYHQNDARELTRTHGVPRFDGFQEVACANRLTVHQLLINVMQDRAEAMARLRALPKPVAILCENDYQAMALCDLCREYHLSVPDEVAVCGVEDDPLICPNNLPPLSSVDVNREEQGYRAAELLARLIAGEPAPEPILIPPRGVVARRSSDRIAIANPQVAAALGVIRDRYREAIGAEDVVAAVGVSRATLYREFQRHFGHSIAAAIAHRRIQHACGLLADGDQELEIVARESGFSGAQHLRRSFLRDKGLTPSAYRERARSHHAEIERIFDDPALTTEERGDPP